MRAAYPEADDGDRGVSAVLCSMARGEAALAGVAGMLDTGESSLWKVLAGNPSLVRSVEPFAQRGEFLGALAGGASVDELRSRWDFRPTAAQRARSLVRGKLGALKRRVMALVGRLGR